MSPPPGDEASSPLDSRTTGGLASVFKGLAGAARLTKPSSAPSQPATSSTVPQPADRLHPGPIATQGLPPRYLEAFERLKGGSETDRVAAAHELCVAVNDHPLNPVLDAWYAAKDMIDPGNSQFLRVAGWELLTECLKYPSSTDLERREFFQTITAPSSPSDFHLQLAALGELTKHGRVVSGFDYDLIPLLSTWLTDSFETTKAARANAKKDKSSRFKGKTVITTEERNFAELFSFLTDVIKFNFNANERAASALVDSLLSICMNASVQEDLRACIGVLETIVTFGAIPSDKFKHCVQVLASVHCLVPQLQKLSWHVFGVLCKTHNGQAIVRLLLEVLASTSRGNEKTREGIREVRGAISILQKLVSKRTEKNYPAVPYTLLVEGLGTVVQSTASTKTHLEILRLTNTLFVGDDGNVNAMMEEEDWAPLLDVAAACASGLLASLPIAEDAREDPQNAMTLIAKELTHLTSRLEVLLLEKRACALLQKDDCISFLVTVQQILPDSICVLVLDYFKTHRCCFPSDSNWEENLKLVLEAFFANRHRSTQVRILALHVVTEIYDMLDLINDAIEPAVEPGLVRKLIENITSETDIGLLQEIVSICVDIASTSDHDLFVFIVGTLAGIVGNRDQGSIVEVPILHSIEAALHGQTQPQSFQRTPSDVVVRGFAHMFMRVMNNDVTKSLHLFNILVAVARDKGAAIDARLTALKLLFRLRADWANRVFLTAHTESDYLATVMYRTEASIARKYAEETAAPMRHSKSSMGSSTRSSRGMSFGQAQAPERGYSMRSASGTKTASTTKTHQLWVASDSDALPENPSQAASPVLFTDNAEQITPEVDSQVGVEAEDNAEEKAEAVSDRSPVEEQSMKAGEDSDVNMEERVRPGLRTSSWLDVVIHLLSHPCDWELYSFVLVYLPSQLSNHAIFKSSVPQIQELRRTICKQIQTGAFQDPPSASGLRRADVAICLFHSLTMILSYHRHFQKTEEDEIVRAFVLGIGNWERSARCCIHALTICCHELPTSISKALVTILQKMSQIITQPYVAMHILEFLACLSRLPLLYANFREDEYRIVFGISFRYLQYVRDKKQNYRVGSVGDSAATLTVTPSASDGPAHPNASDDLPQYVYALAYHVVLFWFLALKLQDRANHVGWIAKNLFMDVDGSQMSEEQAQITLDFMQRVAYADIDESTPDPLFTSERFGTITMKRWLIGNSIVTIEQASATGWAQITKRQPSGTSCYTIRENFHVPPPHQRQLAETARENHVNYPSNNVLPSHLLAQLLSSMPQSNDQARPIPLPEDDAINRAIRMFDHNSTVDGHKVGVIYIGENQRDEAEILANISGSGDYVDFLNGLGTLTKLKDAPFNTQGLDRQYDTDGEYAFCWRDRVTEIVFHVTTQMPTNLDHDPQCTLKKRHIGNDFVNIIFNDSGLLFRFDTFPSEFNFVNIVISPESRASFVATRQRTPNDVNDLFYKVQVMSQPGFPEISPASEPKIVSLKALPEFVRLLALNASVFCLVWANREGGEHVSPWRNRLREINRLREKYGSKAPVTQLPTPSPPATALSHGTAGHSAPAAQLEAARAGHAVRDSFTSLRRSSVATFFSGTSEQSSSHRSSLISTATTDNTEVMAANGIDSLVDSVDFSKWA